MSKNFILIGVLAALLCVVEPRATEPKTNAKAEQNPDPRMFEGDMILPAAMRAGLKNKASLWPNGKVPYTMANTFTAYERDIIKKAMQYIEKVSCIRWVQRTNEKNYVNINQKKPGVCFSAVGISYGWDGQDLNLAMECLRYNQVGTAVHEMLHALGFFHEQSRPDRDDYVDIYWNNIPQNNLHNFNKYTTDFVTTSGTPYDVNSIMHYESTAFSKDGVSPTMLKKGGGKIFRNNEMSPTDIKELNILYQCSGNSGSSGNTDNGNNSNCANEHAYCDFWARVGECGKNPNYMLTKCKKACGKC